LSGSLNLRQIKLQPRDHWRGEFAFLFGGGMQFVPAALEREDFERLVGRVGPERGIHPASPCEVVARWKNHRSSGRRELKRNKFGAPVAKDSRTTRETNPPLAAKAIRQ
jgi:hypothetical protein